uniref:Putative secreted protein n=1 Tax=Anopheles triannulatus TaxID=58253 RepID=A0A2M4B3Q5_9DIPT
MVLVMLLLLHLEVATPIDLRHQFTTVHVPYLHLALQARARNHASIRYETLDPVCVAIDLYRYTLEQALFRLGICFTLRGLGVPTSAPFGVVARTDAPIQHHHRVGHDERAHY